eukprot:108772-Hanusia_phi.AAC.1
MRTHVTKRSLGQYPVTNPPDSGLVPHEAMFYVTRVTGTAGDLPWQPPRLRLQVPGTGLTLAMSLTGCDSAWTRDQQYRVSLVRSGGEPRSPQAFRKFPPTGIGLLESCDSVTARPG